MSKKREYMRVLSTFSSEWILKSAQNPNKFMTRVDVLLHYVVLKHRGYRVPEKLTNEAQHIVNFMKQHFQYIKIGN